MSHFPGIALIIDDLFDKLAYIDDVEQPEMQIQQRSFKSIKQFCDENGLPLTSITSTQDVDTVGKRIRSYNNVRLLILDLDLNNDGSVGEDDDYTLIFYILKEALNSYGYFFLLINSAHSEAWEDIKQKLPGDITIFSKKNVPLDVYDKSENSIFDKLVQLQVNNYSLEVVYDFECGLNKARDLAFIGLLDYEKRTWSRIYKQLQNETSTQAGFLLSSMFLSVLKQFLLDVRYSDPVNTDPIEEEIAIKAFKNVNYTENYKGHLNTHPIWTGNLYYIPEPIIKGMNYALIITPECDIAQNKFTNYQIVLGLEINGDSFPAEYDPKNYVEKTPPLYPYKAGKTKAKWRDRANLSSISNQIEHLYQLPFVTPENNTVILDFRDITFETSDIIASKWKLIARINEPMITDILDKISFIFNRKGLLPLLPTTIKAIR